ncbi:MAG TPA: DUF1778 domain-containing protein [Myxococcales bacterium]
MIRDPANTPRTKPVRRRRRRGGPANKDASLLVRLDRGGKTLVHRAAAALALTVSEYVRTRILSLARQDVTEAETQVLRLSRADQIVFWLSLQNPPPPTAAQRRLGRLIRSVT